MNDEKEKYEIEKKRWIEEEAKRLKRNEKIEIVWISILSLCILLAFLYFLRILLRFDILQLIFLVGGCIIITIVMGILFLRLPLCFEVDGEEHEI